MRKVIAAGFCIIVTSFILFASLTFVQARQVSSQPDFAKIDDYINLQMKSHRIPGLALAIIQEDQILYLRGFGIANPAGEPVSPQTPFIIGSTGKSITATALMMLVDAGKVTLDTPVQEYLPWFRLADESTSAKITVRMLLNQTSGIPGGAGWASQAYSDLSDDALEAQVRSFSSVKFSHEPGSAYEYANANYQVVGMIVQAVSGQSFQSFIQENIYDPLEMSNSYTSRDEARENGMATGYRYWFGYPLSAYNLPYSYRQFPAGWYICSVEDLAHYLIMHMNGGMYGDKALISSDGMATLHRPALGSYAMGWVVEGDLISHNGGTPDFGSELYFDTSSHYGVVVAFNANTGYFYTPSYVIAPSVLRMLTGGQPIQPIPDAWYRAMLTGLAATLGLQLIWLVVSARLVRGWQILKANLPKKVLTKLIWLVLPLLVELGLAYFILSSFQANGRTVFVDFVYQPDIILLSLVSLSLALGWGILRTVLSLRLMITRNV